MHAKRALTDMLPFGFLGSALAIWLHCSLVSLDISQVLYKYDCLNACEGGVGKQSNGCPMHQWGYAWEKKQLDLWCHDLPKKTGLKRSTICQFDVGQEATTEVSLLIYKKAGLGTNFLLFFFPPGMRESSLTWLVTQRTAWGVRQALPCWGHGGRKWKQE